jgi:hypothetical protein
MNETLALRWWIHYQHADCQQFQDQLSIDHVDHGDDKRMEARRRCDNGCGNRLEVVEFHLQHRGRIILRDAVIREV